MSFCTVYVIAMLVTVPRCACNPVACTLHPTVCCAQALLESLCVRACSPFVPAKPLFAICKSPDLLRHARPVLKANRNRDCISICCLCSMTCAAQTQPQPAYTRMQ